MYLLTVNEWVGPGSRMTIEEKKKITITERVILFVTHMMLSDALDELIKYQKAYNEKYPIAVSFRLLGIRFINEFLSKDALMMLGVEYIENLMENLKI